MGADLYVVTLLRWGVLVLSAYLAAVTVLGVALRLARAHVLARAVDIVTPVLARRAVAAIAGVVLGLPTAAAAQAPSTDPPVVMHRLPDAPVTPPTTVVVERTTAPVAPVAPAPPPAVNTTWTIAPGEHFWAVAEETLAAHWGRAPSDAEVVPYWRRLIEANRDRLHDRANPDLVFPGQVLVLPAPPPAPT